MRMAGQIQPYTFFEADVIDDQSVTLPLADGISEPCGVRISRELASICEYLPVEVIRLEQQDDKTRLFNNLPRGDVTVGIRHTVGDAVPIRPILAVIPLTFLINLLRPRLHLD